MTDPLLFSVNKNINAFFNCIKIYYNKKSKNILTIQKLSIIINVSKQKTKNSNLNTEFELATWRVVQ